MLCAHGVPYSPNGQRAGRAKMAVPSGRKSWCRVGKIWGKLSAEGLRQIITSYKHAAVGKVGNTVVSVMVCGQMLSQFMFVGSDVTTSTIPPAGGSTTAGHTLSLLAIYCSAKCDTRAMLHHLNPQGFNLQGWQMLKTVAPWWPYGFKLYAHIPSCCHTYVCG